MYIKRLLLIALLAVVLAGCKEIPTTNPSPTTTPTIRPKQPEPGRPLVEGEISGVLDNTLVTIHIHTPDGWEALWGTQQGNGHWKAVVTDTSGIDYTITAEADGFICSPNSYTIQLAGMVAYVVENGQVTIEEATHLDFHFTPATTSTPTK